MTSGRRVSASVVIAVARDDYGLLGRQLGQLARQVPGTPEFEVVVGDNDGELEADQLPVSVRVVDASDRLGAAHARNRAAASARGDLLLFCDADDLVGPEWVLGHVAGLASSGLTAGSLRLVDLEDPLIHRVVSSSEWPNGGFSTQVWCHENVPIAPSGNMGVQRAAFVDVGGFPTDYIRSQDVALSLALGRSGTRPAFVPRAQVLYVSTSQPAVRRRAIHRDIGVARARLHEDFGVGPGSGRLVLRAAARTARAVLGPLLPDPPARSSSEELAELVGIVTQITRRP